jgi:carboxyl-terminal processing protease
MSRVQEGAMRGLIDALDPYCSFLSKDQYEALQRRKIQGTASAGMILSKRADIISVVSTERGGAAEEAGIRPGDYVVALDGVDIENKSIMEADSLLHGAAGTKVRATIFRSARTKPLEVDVILKSTEAIPVVSKMLDGDVGLLDISSPPN